MTTPGQPSLEQIESGSKDASDVPTPATGPAREKWRWFSADRWSLFFDGTITIATVVGLVFLILQWKQTDEALKEARAANEIASATSRPWLKVDDVLPRALTFVGREFQFMDGPASVAINVRVDLRNVGTSVATEVRGLVSLMLPLWQSGFGEDIPAVVDSTCQEIETNKIGSTSLFPDETYNLNLGVTRPLDDKSINVDARTGAKAVVGVLVGCIVYRVGSSLALHRTTFVYSLARAENRSRFFPIGQSLSDSQFLLIRERAHDFAN